MFNAHDLTQEQKDQLQTWADQGSQLSDLQQKITEELGISVTYLDVRFAIIDLGIELKQEVTEEPEEEVKESPIPIGHVEVDLDTIMRLGYMVSGKVTFSDGVKALWGLNEMGQLSVDADDPDYKIDDADMLAFQETLRDKLQRK